MTRNKQLSPLTVTAFRISSVYFANTERTRIPPDTGSFASRRAGGTGAYTPVLRTAYGLVHTRTVFAHRVRRVFVKADLNASQAVFRLPKTVLLCCIRNTDPCVQDI